MPTMPPTHRAPGARTRRQRDKEYEDRRRARDPQRTTRYNSWRWKAIRKRELTNDPNCAMHRALFGEIVEATSVNHVTPWRHDADSFYVGPFESLCETCHAKVTNAENHSGVPWAGAEDKDGNRIEPGHPFYDERLHLYGSVRS